MPRRTTATPAADPQVDDTTTLAPELTLEAEFVSRLDTLRGHAVACGRLDCGHLGKSDSQAVRRAVILYTAEGSGVTLDLTGETPEVTATLGVLRSAQHARPVYTRGGRNNRYSQVANGLTLVMPDANGIKVTQQRLETFTSMLRGMSANQVAAQRGRNLETIKSHAGYLRRLTGAHDATSALIALVLAGKLADPAMVIPGGEDDATEE